MKLKFLLAAALACALTLSSAAFAAEAGADAPKADAPAGVSGELMTLVNKIKAKLADGKNTEKDLDENLKEFDVILDQHKSEKTDEVAQVLFMKAILYLQVLDNDEKGTALIKQLKKDFPDTAPGKKADDILENIAKQGEAKKIQKSLAVGNKFPDFDEKDVDGKPFSIANYKGKVVLLDFWATWCGPCVGELPNVLETYKKHHGEGFEILGISLDQEESSLRDFVKKRGMAWQQYFDGKGWGNKLAGKYGVNSIPATYLLDGEGKIIAHDVRGEALEAAVAKALGKN
jgi:peroxiredoxin